MQQNIRIEQGIPGILFSSISFFSFFSFFLLFFFGERTIDSTFKFIEQRMLPMA